MTKIKLIKPMLVGNHNHEPGDVFDVLDARAWDWIHNGVAEKYVEPPKEEKPKLRTANVKVDGLRNTSKEV